jgi:uncharacterized protein
MQKNDEIRKSQLIRCYLSAWLLFLMIGAAAFASSILIILFLGDDGLHKPRERFSQLEPVLRAPFVMPEMTELPVGPLPFEYIDVGAKIPNYVVSEKWGTQGEPFHRMQKPLSPKESMRRMVVPKGFHVELFAAEPDLGGKPICMTWDAKGRLWVGETLDYPNELKPRNRGRDRIWICEDTNADGRADKFTVFAEDLSIPTSIAFSHGGAIVHNGTETLFLKDNDGDDRADERRVLLSSWSMGDTHGGPSNMQYGLDNWIWGMQGYNRSTIHIGDTSTRFAQGFYRFRPDGSQIEFLRSTNNNTWGIGISEEGVVFGSTANGNPSIYMPIPNRYYEQVRGWTPQLTLSSIADRNEFHAITSKVRQVDHHGGYTAAAGHALYTARAYPRQYWNRTAFVCEPTGHLISIFLLAPQGADFHSTSPGNLLASDDEWTSPIMAEVGPDGFVWFIDWYNYIVQHNPTPEGFKTGKGAAYETDLRDERHGRIYRIVCDAATPGRQLDLRHAPPKMLVATLSNDNLLWRRHAQRLLVERGQLDVVPQLVELLENKEADEIGLNIGAIHALWTLHGLGAIDERRPQARAAVMAALKHPSAGVRRNAVQVLDQSENSANEILTSRLLSDADAQVQLQTLLALATMPPSEAAGRAIAELVSGHDSLDDRWRLDAATSAAAAHAPHFLAASTEVAVPSSQLLEVAEIAANHLARNSAGKANQLLMPLANANPLIAGAIIRGLRAGWPSGSPDPNGDAVDNLIKQLRTQLTVEDQVQLAMLARRARIESMPFIGELSKTLFEKIEDESIAVAERVHAAELAVAMRPDHSETVTRLLDFLTPLALPEFSLGLIRALGSSTAPSLGAIVIERQELLTPSGREAVFELLLARPQLTAALIEAMENGTVRPLDLSTLQRQRFAEYPDRALRRRARSVLAASLQVVDSDRAKVLEEYKDALEGQGNPANGAALFKKHCATCHKFHDQGTSIGPDLSGIAASGKEHLLVNILDPSRDIENNYRAYVIVLSDGRVLNGLLAGESATSIELVDAQATRHQILREEIEILKRSDASLMPEGFEKTLSHSDIVDMLEFLMQPPPAKQP